MKYLIIILCLFTSGCSAIGENRKINGVKNTKTSLETLYAFKVERGVMYIKVKSNGCTKASHFRLDYNELNTDLIEVGVMRLKKDYCRKKPALINVEIVLDAQMLSKKAWQVINPFSEFSLIIK